MPSVAELLESPSGAQWLKVDLHVHTPASSDIAEKWLGATPDDLVRIAIQKGVDVIGITDHNSADWCDGVRMAAENTTLTVFPGVEISTRQGHILALFDTMVPSAQIEDLLVRVGIAREDFGSLHVATAGGIQEVSAEIAKAGGVAIAAHADGNRGFLKTIQVGAERERAYLASALRAIELLDSTARDEHQSGKRYPRSMTCIQSSDSWPEGADHHDLDGIAHRHTFLKMGERSLSGLKLALLDPAIRVRLANDESPTPSCSILGLWVTGGFLDGEQLRFSDNVNCLIGDTGAGKSVTIELIRFGLNQQAGVPKILEEAQSLLRQRLGNLNMVHILLARNGNRYLVERAWGTPPGSPTVQRSTESGLEPIEDVDIRSLFPIKAFSQSEIIEFAREPQVRLSLTDDLIDCSLELASISELKTRLRTNAGEIAAELAREESSNQRLSERASLREAIQDLDRILSDPGIEKHQFWYSEQNLLDSLKTQIDQLGDSVSAIDVNLALAPNPPETIASLPNQDLLVKLNENIEEWKQTVKGASQVIEAGYRKLMDDLMTLRKEWDTRYHRAEEDYLQLLRDLDREGIGLQALSDRRRSIQRKVNDLDEVDHDLQNNILPRIHSLRKEREDLLNKLQDNRKAITSKRQAKSEELTSKLNKRIRLNVHARSNTTIFRNALQSIAQGARLVSTDLDSISAKCHPVPLVKKLLDGSFDDLAVQCGLEQSKIIRLWEVINERNRIDDLYDLQLTDVEDHIEVQLDVNQGQYRQLEELSHGQKCMVILMVALAEGAFPLLVDQPEDALHAPSIEEGIVSTLRSGRGTRQCIFATRNANILVSADAEQIIALKADANNGKVDGTGSLDKYDHRGLIIYHVEGGEEAFQRRKTMYSLEPSD